ncbi:CotD family spore coat protein [Virgibacillus profundi]|uniref:CotD family spore coat protein n=1 Tax=Virgibacillus profundi TaxID=2024555 RepID=UPI001F0A96FD|nr:CotD family spore coat protein [Virgibacillus profundi]
MHPTEVENVNRTIVRNEHYYPVSNADVNDTVVQNYDCGSDLNSPNCRRISPESNRNCQRTSPERNRNRCNCGCKRWSWI